VWLIFAILHILGKDSSLFLACMCSAPAFIFVIKRVCRWSRRLGQTLLVSFSSEETSIVETDRCGVVEHEDIECLDPFHCQCGHLRLFILAGV
jgi:hypothetical protein